METRQVAHGEVDPTRRVADRRIGVDVAPPADHPLRVIADGLDGVGHIGLDHVHAQKAGVGHSRSGEDVVTHVVAVADARGALDHETQ